MTLAARDLLAYLAARVLPAGATMGLSLLCIHWLSAEQYAVYSAAQAAAGVAVGFVGGMSGQALLRYARELAPRALQRGLVIVPLVAAALVCPLLLGWLAWHAGATASTWVAAALVPLLALLDTRRSLFVANGQAGQVFRLDAWRAGLALPLALMLLHGWGLHAAAPLMAQCLSVLMGLWLVRAALPAEVHPGSRRIDGAYLHYGLGIACWMAGIVALSVAERAVLADAAGMAASGGYAAQADTINAIFAAGSGALAAALMPSYLAQSRAADGVALRRLRSTGLLGVLATATICLLFGVVLAWAGEGRIVAVLTGDVSTALVLVAGAAAWAAAGFVQKPVELSGRTWRLFGGVATALLLFLLVAPTLAAQHGATGVAAARLMAGVAYAVIALVLARRAG